MDAVVQAQDRRARAVDLERHVLVPQWREEAEPFQVIEVQVRQEEMDAPRSALHQIGAQRADTRSGIEDQRRLIVKRDLDAGRVTPAADSPLARSGDRAPGSPELNGK